MDGCIFRDNLIDDAGVFWYFPPYARENSAHETRVFPTVSLLVRGNGNVLRGNVISCSHAASVVLQGDGNVLSDTVADGDVLVEGNGNTVSNLVFTTPKARLRVRGAGNRLFGIPPERLEGPFDDEQK